MANKILTMAVAAAALSVAGIAPAALTVTQNSNIGTARTAFGGSTVLNWNAAGAPGSVVATPPSTLAIGEWITGTGFETLDLAISGNESFVWSFAAPVSRIGFAVSTGTGLLPSEVRETGAVFNLLTNTGQSATLTLAPGPGFTTWVEINAPAAFSSISFTDTTDIWDQYFGNVLAAASAVPEPAAWALMILGFGLAGGALRYRRGKTGLTFA